MLAGIEGAVDRRGGRLAGSQQFGDYAVLHDQPAGGVLVVGGEEGEGVLDPDAGCGHGRLLLTGASKNYLRCHRRVESRLKMLIYNL